jgi:hypothetical protein
MRMEGEKEFRIYCEDLEDFPIRVMTKGFCAALSEAYDCRMKEARELRAAAQNCDALVVIDVALIRGRNSP